MSHPHHPASPPSSHHDPMFQRIRPPGGNQSNQRGQAPWILRALYGATSFGLLADPAGLAHAGGRLNDHGPSSTMAQATQGDSHHMVQLRGPIATQGRHEHAVQALQAGSLVLSGAVTTSGDDAYAVYYSGAARVIMTDVDIATKGARAHAVRGFRGQGAYLPDWAASRQGDLELRHGTVTLQGPDSIGMDVTATTARLGRPLRETGDAALWSMGYTHRVSANEPDVRIEGHGERNTGIAIKGPRRLELNGVGIVLREAGAVGMSVGPTARIDGKNIGITASGTGSFGLRVRGDPARREDTGHCPVPTAVNLANGYITMTGHDAPAVDLVRARVSLEDFHITTSTDARFAVGNESGRFRMEGKQARAVIRGVGSALAAWTGNDREAAVYDFRNVSIHSGSGSLLEVGRDSGDAGPALPAHVELTLDNSNAQGRIWGGNPGAPRVDVRLTDGSTWQGQTDLGRTITVETASTWKVDGDSKVEDVVLDGGTIAFQNRDAVDEHSRISTTEQSPIHTVKRSPIHATERSRLHAEQQRSDSSSATRRSEFRRLHVLRDMRGAGVLQIRADAARRSADHVLIDGSAHGDIAVDVRDTGAMTDFLTSIDVIHAARGGPANFTLANNASRVHLAQQPFELRTEKARDSPAVTVWLVPEDAPFIRGHATLDLGPAHREPRVIAEIGPYGSVFDGMQIAPVQEPAAPVHAAPPTRGVYDRKKERDIPTVPDGTVHHPRTTPHPPRCANDGSCVTVDVDESDIPSPRNPLRIHVETSDELYRRSPIGNEPDKNTPQLYPGTPVVMQLAAAIPDLTLDVQGSHVEEAVIEKSGGTTNTDTNDRDIPGDQPHPTVEPKPELAPAPDPESQPEPGKGRDGDGGGGGRDGGDDDDGGNGNGDGDVDVDVDADADADGDGEGDGKVKVKVKAKVKVKVKARREDGGERENKDEGGGEGEGDGEGEGEGEGEGDGDGDGDAADDKQQADPPAPAEAPATPPPEPIVLSPGARLAVDNAALAAGQGIWNAQLGALNRRTRTIRGGYGAALPSGMHALDSTGTGIWFEATDGRQKIDNPLTGEYRQDLYGLVMGIDRAFDVAAGRWHIGLLAAQIISSRDFSDGKGRTRSTHVGGYATFIGPQGSYATAVVAAGRYRHDMHGKRADGTRLSGAFRNKGAGASIEAGRRVDLPRGWLVEPHAGVDYLRVGGARYSLSDGTAVRDQGGHSLQWRAGTRLGRVIEMSNGGTATPYVRAGYVHEQGNRNRVSVDGASLNANLGGSRAEVGAGVEARLGKAHSLYVDVGYAKGKRFEQARALTVGYQYRW